MLLFGAWTLKAQNWAELGTGTNALNPNDGIMALATDAAGNIYAAGSFTNAAGKQYVAKWNGSFWAEMGTGSNALNANGWIRSIAVDPSGNLYAAGDFVNTAGKQYVAKWNGSFWAEMGTGSNALNANGWIFSITTDASGNVYAAGVFSNTAGKRYVAKWNGTSWSEVGTGTNALDANNWIVNITTDPSGNLYATGFFTNAALKNYLAKWNGTSWSEVGTGANALNPSDAINSIATDQAGNIYVAGYFTNTAGKYYVAKWNGSSWSELGTGSNALNADGWLFALAKDPSGNLYAGGSFVNTAGKQYVAKWNGTSWAELGTGANALNANSNIVSIISDQAGAIYTTGAFTNSLGKRYVAKWSNSTVPVDSVDVRTVGNVPPMITTNAGTLPMTAVVFPATASQDVIWSIVPGTGTATINTSGVVTAIANGTVWAKAVSLSNTSKKDSMLINLSNQVVAVDSVDVRTVGNVPAIINTNAGTLPMTAVVFPATASQDVSWSIVPGTGTANISAAGVVTAQTNGTVWAKAVSVANTTKMDSLLINISNQAVAVAVDSMDVRTVGNVPAVITTLGAAGNLPLTAVVFPATASQDVSWSIVPGTGTANISATGAVTGLSNGTVWAKAVSTTNTSKTDSLLIEIRSTGIKDKMADMGIKLYPNPAGKELFLAVEQAHNELEMNITDLSGRAVMTKAYAANSLNRPVAINIKELTPGIYFLRLRGTGMDITLKFIKK
ncbi:MAG: hypothetical protein BGO31_02745 [Bacteroidetes bacterium 43-16]|nr:MAG: hypothetical protein BGO31_02745 [Bacteroidetes bacterium 43-16]